MSECPHVWDYDGKGEAYMRRIERLKEDLEAEREEVSFKIDEAWALAIDNQRLQSRVEELERVRKAAEEYIDAWTFGDAADRRVAMNRLRVQLSHLAEETRGEE